ncbi:hypothetical protein EGW08_001528 [Elysia chlorotica]|uniref:Uncharacterized protein n=1 Tax=Elysia chlorotica TaxID=188477 RepID=A0A3S1AFR6_ELYCH|nr:hypothetical protein EGW08_001528 [Elysia chlorotica]
MPKRKSNRGGRGGGAVTRQTKIDSDKGKETFVESEENKVENDTSKSASNNELNCDINVCEHVMDQNALSNTQSNEAAKQAAINTDADIDCPENPVSENVNASAIVTSPLTDKSVKGHTSDVNNMVKAAEVNVDIIINDITKKNREDIEKESLADDSIPDITNSKENSLNEDVTKKCVSENNKKEDSAVNQQDMTPKEPLALTESHELVSSESSTAEGEVKEENPPLDNRTAERSSLKAVNVPEGSSERKLTSNVNTNYTPCVAGDALETVSVGDENSQDDGNKPCGKDSLEAASAQSKSIEDEFTEAEKISDTALEAISVQDDDFEDEPMEAGKTIGLEGDALETISVQDDNFEDDDTIGAGKSSCLEGDALETVSVQDNFEDEPMETGKATCSEGDALEAISVQDDNFDDDLSEAGKADCLGGDALETVSVQDNFEDDLLEAEDSKQDSEDEEIQYVDEEADEQNLLDLISDDQNYKSKQYLNNSKFEEISEGSINQAEQEEVLNESFSDVEIVGETFASPEKKTVERSERRTQNKEAESLEEVFFATENDHSKVTAEDKDNDDISDASLSDHDNMSLEEISDDDVDVSKKKKSIESASKANKDEKSKQVSKTSPTAQVDNSKSAPGTAHDGAVDKSTEGKKIANQGNKKPSPSKEKNSNANPPDKERPSQEKSKDAESVPDVQAPSSPVKGPHQKEESNSHTSKAHDRKVSKASQSESQRGSSDLPQQKVMANSASQTAPHQMKGKIVQCNINPIKSVHQSSLVEADLLNESKTTSKFLTQFREKLPYSIPEDIIAKITSPHSSQENSYSLSLGPITFADMGSTEFRENLLRQSDKFNIIFDEHHHGIYKALFKNQENVAEFVRRLKNLEIGSRYMTISLSYGEEKISNGVVNLMYDQDIQSKKQQSTRGDAKLRAKVQLSGVPDGISKDFVHLLFPEALTITSGPLFDNKRSLLLGFSSTTLAQEMLLCHDLVVVNGLPVSMSPSDYVESSATDSHSYMKDGSVFIDVASESCEEVTETEQTPAEPMIVEDSGATSTSVTQLAINGGDKEKSICNEGKPDTLTEKSASDVVKPNVMTEAEPMETLKNDTNSLNAEKEKEHGRQHSIEMSSALAEKHGETDGANSQVCDDKVSDAQQDTAMETNAGEKTESIANISDLKQSSSEEIGGGHGNASIDLVEDRMVTADCEKEDADKVSAVRDELVKSHGYVANLGNKSPSQIAESSLSETEGQADAPVADGARETKNNEDNLTSCSSETRTDNEDITAPSTQVATSDTAVSDKGMDGDNINNSNADKLTSDVIEAKGKDESTSVPSEADATGDNTCVSSAPNEAKPNNDKQITDTATPAEVSEKPMRADKDPQKMETVTQKDPVANKSLEDVSDEEMLHQDKEEAGPVDDVVILREDSSTTVIAKIDLTLEESTGSDVEEKSSKSAEADAENRVRKNSAATESDERLLMTDAGFEIDMEVIDVKDDESPEEKVIYSKHVSKHQGGTSRTSREPSQTASAGRAPIRDSVNKSKDTPRLSPKRESRGRKNQPYVRTGPYRPAPSRESTAERRDSSYQYERRRSRSPASYRDSNWYRDAPPVQRQSFFPPASDRSQYPSSRPPYTYKHPQAAPEQQWKATYEAPSHTYYPDPSRQCGYSRAPAPESDRRPGYQYQPQPPPHREGSRGGRPEASPPWRAVQHSRGRDFQVPRSQHEKRRASPPPPSKHRSRSRSLSDMSESDYGEPPAKKSNKRMFPGGASSSARNRKVSRSPISISSRSRSLSPVSGSPSPDRNLLRNEIVKSVKQFLHVAREIQQVKGGQQSSQSGSPPVRHVSSSRRALPQKASVSPRRQVMHSSSRHSPPPAQPHRPKSRSPGHQNWGSSSRKRSRSPKQVRKNSYKHRSPSPVSSESSRGSPPPPPSMRTKEYRREVPSGYRPAARLAPSSKQSYRTSSRSRRSRELMPDVALHRRERSSEKKVGHSTWGEQQRQKMLAAETQLKQQSMAPLAPPSMPASGYLHSGGPAYPYSPAYPPPASSGYHAYPPSLPQPMAPGPPYQPQYQPTYVPPGAFPPGPAEAPQVADAYQQAFSILKTALGELHHQPQQQAQQAQHVQHSQQAQQAYPSHTYPRNPSPPLASSSSQSASAARAQTKSWSMGSNAMVFQRVLGNQGLSRKKSGTIELLPVGDRSRPERPKVAKEIRVLTSIPTKKR